MNEWLTYITLSVAQAYLVYLVVNSSLSLKAQHKLRLHNLLKELLSCPICIGFWIALVLVKGKFIDTCVVAFLGGILYEAKEKLLPCGKCSNKVNPSEWKIS